MATQRGVFVAAVCWLGLAAPLGAQPAPRLDLHGDPLPPGALARLGTLRWRQDTGITALAYSPDGKVLATAAGKEVHLWATADGKPLQKIAAAASALAFSRDGKKLAVAHNVIGARKTFQGEVKSGWRGTVRVFDVQTAAEVVKL